jgi:hypothetical protein
VWKVFVDPVHPYPNAKELLGFCVAHYTFPLEQLRPLNKLRVAIPRSAAVVPVPASPEYKEMEEAFRSVSGSAEVETGAEETSSAATSDSTPAEGAVKSEPPPVSSTVINSCAQGRNERQWAFVSYHHLRERLEDTVLHLLERLYGRRWYCSCGGNGLHTGFTWTDPPSGNTSREAPQLSPPTCYCAGDLDVFRAALHSEQLNIGTSARLQSFYM